MASRIFKYKFLNSTGFCMSFPLFPLPVAIHVPKREKEAFQGIQQLPHGQADFLPKL